MRGAPTRCVFPRHHTPTLSGVGCGAAPQRQRAAVDPTHGARACVETHLCGAATAPPALCLHPHRCLHAFSSVAHALAARQGCFSGHQAGRGVCSQGSPCTAPLLAARPGPTPAHTCPARVGTCDTDGRGGVSWRDAWSGGTWRSLGHSTKPGLLAPTWRTSFSQRPHPERAPRRAGGHAHRCAWPWQAWRARAGTRCGGQGRRGCRRQGAHSGLCRTPSSVISDAPHTRSAHYL